MPPLSFGDNRLTEHQLLPIALAALKHTKKFINQRLKKNFAKATQRRTIYSPQGKPKDILFIDELAEEACKEFLESHLERIGHKDELRVLGEEMLWMNDYDLSNEDRYVAILDMIDGSDLLERGLSNWCSAMTFFDPREPRLLFSFVQMSDDKIYLAHSEGAFLVNGRQGMVALLGPAPVSLDSAGICFYGQQVRHFTAVSDSFRTWLQNISGRNNKCRLRLYNLAGNPMMVKLANREGIHIVFEHLGQFPHDAVPGLHIGIKAGAKAVNDTQQLIDEEALAGALRFPSRGRIKYVLAPSTRMARQVGRVLWRRRKT